MPPHPDPLRQIKLQIAMIDGPVISFANITEEKDAGRVDISSLVAGRLARRGDGESHRIPPALSRRPATTARVPQIAERLQHMLRRKFSVVPGSGAAPAPSAPQR